MTFVPSDEQQAIFEAVLNGTGNVAVAALAGCGKTTILVELAKKLPPKGSKIFCAFNKSIVGELEERLKGTGMAAKTFHSMGYSALRKELNVQRLEPDGLKYKQIAADWAESSIDLRTAIQEAVKEEEDPFEREKLAQELRKDTVKMADSLLNFLRLKLIDWDAVDGLNDLIAQYRLDDDVTPAITDLVVNAVPELMKTAEKNLREKAELDFTDMIYWVVKWNLKIFQYQWVFADECLPYRTPVHLADGTALPIGEIVEKKLPVTVLAYDTTTGEQRPCRVTGWHKLFNRKPLVKIKVRWTKSHRQVVPGGYTQTPTNFVVCTVDHKVWADNQWLAAGSVKPGMVMQVETAAHKSQAYKITSKGRRTLSEAMSLKNQLGITSGTSSAPGFAKRGGNGTPLTVPQHVLWQALGDDWQPEYAVPTKMERDSGYPTAYKVDIAHPERMLAVEVDGHSHQARDRKKQDVKKQKFLEKLGWTVIRVPNRDAIQKTEQIVTQLSATCIGDDCPLDAVVVSVEPVEIPDYFVYDITVEDCHNFYANGILVHNCQDLNPMQRTMIQKALWPQGGRIVLVGDANQSIYTFAGADSDSFILSVNTFDCTVLPMTLTRRCAQIVTEHAAQLVPDFRCLPDKPRGKIVWIDEQRLVNTVESGDLILSRVKAPLVGACLDLISAGKSATIIGGEIGKALIGTLEKLARRKGYTFETLLKHLKAYETEQVQRLQQKDDEATAEAIRDQCAAIFILVDRYVREQPTGNYDGLVSYIERLFSNEGDNRAISLATVHKAKGLEADRVFILKPEKLPLNFPNQRDESAKQEDNLDYVARTRAKSTLVYLTNEKFLEKTGMPAYAQDTFDDLEWNSPEPDAPPAHDETSASAHLAETASSSENTETGNPYQVGDRVFLDGKPMTVESANNLTLYLRNKENGTDASVTWRNTKLRPDLPKRQVEFLRAVGAGEPVVKNAATRKAMEEKGLIVVEDRDKWGNTLTPRGRKFLDMLNAAGNTKSQPAVSDSPAPDQPTETEADTKPPSTSPLIRRVADKGATAIT